VFAAASPTRTLPHRLLCLERQKRRPIPKREWSVFVVSRQRCCRQQAGYCRLSSVDSSNQLDSPLCPTRLMAGQLTARKSCVR
jgi:hypothetical protein